LATIAESGVSNAMDMQEQKKNRAARRVFYRKRKLKEIVNSFDIILEG